MLNFLSINKLINYHNLNCISFFNNYELFERRQDVRGMYTELGINIETGPHFSNDVPLQTLIIHAKLTSIMIRSDLFRA